jgi:hypothetical protein
MTSAADNGSDKRQTSPPVRKGAPQKHDRKSLTVNNIWSWAADGAGHQDWLTDRQSQCDFDFDTVLGVFLLIRLTLRLFAWSHAINKCNVASEQSISMRLTRNHIMQVSRSVHSYTVRHETFVAIEKFTCVEGHSSHWRDEKCVKIFGWKETPVTVGARSMAWKVFARAKHGIMGSNVEAFLVCIVHGRQRPWYGPIPRPKSPTKCL